MPSEAKPDPMRQLLQQVSDVRAKGGVGSEALYYMGAIDTKTSALLAHLSMMIAAVSFFYSQAADGTGAKTFYGVEILLYLATTLWCLRGIFILRPKASPALQVDQLIELRIREVDARLKSYGIAMTATIMTTLVFMLTVLCHLLALERWLLA
jgi:hypothetical protein